MASEETVYDKDNVPGRENQPSNGQPKEPKDKKGLSGKVMAGIGAGVILGTAASFMTANAAEIDVDDENADDLSEAENNSYADESIDVATTVSDDMSFAEAFAEAREEVGPGGAFEWRGNVYSTFTAEEWNEMSQEEKSEFNSHFSWAEESGDEAEPLDGADDDVEPADEPVEVEPVTDPADEPVDDSIEVEPVTDSADDSVEVEPVDEPGIDDMMDAGDDMSASVEEPAFDAEDVEVVTDDVEILGVYEDAESGANIGSLMVDGQEVILVDVDGEDGAFDLMGADLNHDGEITEDEMLDISEDQISISEFEDNCMGSDELYAMDDGTADYINDAGDDSCMA